MMKKTTIAGRGFWLVAIVAFLMLTVGSGFRHPIGAQSEETYEGLKLFSDVIELVEKNYVEPVDTKDLIQKAIQGMVSSLDPHSALLPPEAFEELQMDTKGEFGGIGIVITMQNGRLTVISPIEGTPAYRAGIRARDIIIKVDGENTKDLQLWESVKRMRGPKGTSVTITIFREGVEKPMDFSLVRDIIPIESVKYTAIKPGYGYVWVTNFQDNTSIDVQAALQDLESKDNLPLKGLILDLRDNPGGLLAQSIEVADIFLEKGDIVSIKGRLARHTKSFSATTTGTPHEYPVVVLINGGSASAAEIVAGALQDNKRALLMGTTSFGKGSVQTVETLRDGYGLKFTIARYYTPSGRSIQAEGIHPDIVVEGKMLEKLPDDKTDDGLIKEKDLKNHLEAETNLADDVDPESGEGVDKKKEDAPGNDRHGPLKLEHLLRDNQVVRALDLLVSYDIFKKIAK